MDKIQQILIKKYGEVAGKSIYNKYLSIKGKRQE
jgi:hypothetical protein